MFDFLFVTATDHPQSEIFLVLSAATTAGAQELFSKGANTCAKAEQFLSLQLHREGNKIVWPCSVHPKGAGSR